MSTFEQKLFSALRPKRTAIRKRRKAGTRQRTDERDRLYIEWMHTHFCAVGHRRPDSPCSGVLTVHHLRHITHADGRIERTGRLDRRTLPLCQGHHQTGPHAVHKMTADHGREWDRFFGIDQEQEVRHYNALYDRVDPECECRFTGDRADASECPLHGVSGPVRLVMEVSDGDRCPF